MLFFSIVFFCFSYSHFLFSILVESLYSIFHGFYCCLILRSHSLTSNGSFWSTYIYTKVYVANIVCTSREWTCYFVSFCCLSIGSVNGTHALCIFSFSSLYLSTSAQNCTYNTRNIKLYHIYTYTETDTPCTHGTIGPNTQRNILWKEKKKQHNMNMTKAQQPERAIWEEMKREERKKNALECYALHRQISSI